MQVINNIDNILDLPVDDSPTEWLFDIDISAITGESNAEAKEIIKTVGELFYTDTEDFKSEHPRLYKRMMIELDTLRGLIKMRRADEEAHDAILRAICVNSSDSSLYRALTDIQKTSILLSTKIQDTIDKLGKICTDVKATEAIIDQSDNNNEEDDSTTNIFRGSKSFIKNQLQS